MSRSKVNLLIILICIYSQYISHCNSAACQALTQEGDCSRNPSCGWNGLADPPCYCDSDTPLDVIFIIDESGSLGKKHFKKELAFVADMILQGLSNISNVHVTKFASKMRPVYNFTQDQSDKAHIASVVNSASYKKGGTRMSDALRYVQKVFTHQWTTGVPGYKGYQKLLVFLTDGKPSNGYEPCQEVEATQAIVGLSQIIVIGMGNGWTRDSIECMVTPGYPAASAVPDDARILAVDNFADVDFDAAGLEASDFLCPDPFELKLTEIRISNYTNGNQWYQSRFIEVHNDGAPILLTQNNLRLDGFMTSAVFGITGDAGCNITIGSNQYVVFYDPAFEIPTCPDCNCTLNGVTTQCDESLYIPCDSNVATSTCGACTWNSSMSDEGWSQTVYDYANDAVLATATRDPSDVNASWVAVFSGYSTELKQLSNDPAEPGSWTMSCYHPGTPGAGPIKPCNRTCVVDICQSQGDSGASCDDTREACKCSAELHYFASETSGCQYLPAPVDCYVTNEYDEYFSDVIASIYWSAGGTYENGVRFRVNDGTTTLDKYGWSAFPGRAIRGDATVTVTAVIDDPVNGEVTSASAICPVTTVSPTTEPTAAPTNSNADIDTCTAVIHNDDSGGYIIDVQWSEGYKGESTDIDKNEDGTYEYWIFGEFIPGNPSTEISQFTTVLSETLRTNTLDFPDNPPYINVVTKFINTKTNGIDYNLMSTPGAGMATCSVVTQAPTKAPTNVPSQTPTKTPTNVPTVSPTPGPTYAARTLDECFVEIPPRDQVSDPGVEVTFIYDEPEDSGPNPIIYFVVNGVGIESTQGGFMLASLDQSVVEAAIATHDEVNSGFEAYIEYQASPGNYVESEKIKCQFTTIAPTRSPTVDPTQSPTKEPTQTPSISPTKSPTDEPTPSPTFQDLTLTNCTVEVNADKTVLIVDFKETTFDDDNPIYPDSSDIFYEVRTGPLKTGNDYVVNTIGTTESDGKKTIVVEIDDEFVVGKTEVTIDIANNLGDSANLPIICNLITQTPTAAPTTLAPTPYPTTINPVVRLDLIDSEGNVKDWGFDGECTNLATDAPNRRRGLLQDITTTEVPAELVNPCPFCPICPIKENEDPKYIRIVREPIDWPYDLEVHLKVTHLVDTDDEGISADDFDYDKIDDKDWEKLFKSQGQFVRKYMLGQEEAQIIIPYYLKQDDIADRGEAFQVSIDGCIIDESGGAENAVPDGLKGKYSCITGLYYPSVIIQVDEPEVGDAFTQTTVGEIPIWVWYPVGAAGVIIPVLGYLIWRWWNAKKIADAMEIQRKHELKEAEKQDDIGDFGTVGDNVTANPLATGDAFEVPTGDKVINHHLDIEKMQFETATVEVEHNIFKQDFGPVQAEKNKL